MDQSEIKPSSNEEEAEAKGFGKLYFSTQASKQQEERSDNEQDLVSDVISRKELEKGRLSRDGKCNAQKCDRLKEKETKFLSKGVGPPRAISVSSIQSLCKDKMHSVMQGVI